MADTEKPAQEDKKEESLPGNMNGINRDIVYYYSREHRLSMSSPIVQNMYEKKTSRPGLSSRFFGSRPNLIFFISIILICIMFGISMRSAAARVMKLGGNSIVMVLLNEEGTQVLSIEKKAPSSGEIYLGPVEIAVLPGQSKLKEDGADIAQAAFIHRIEFNAVDSETFRVPLPFNGDDFFVAMRTNDEQKTMRVKAVGNKRK